MFASRGFTTVVVSTPIIIIVIISEKKKAKRSERSSPSCFVSPCFADARLGGQPSSRS